jgi:hypothetical protein
MAVDTNLRICQGLHGARTQIPAWMQRVYYEANVPAIFDVLLTDDGIKVYNNSKYQWVLVGRTWLNQHLTEEEYASYVADRLTWR